MEDSNIKSVEKLSLRFGLFDGNTQVCLQGDNLMAVLTISSNMGKEHFRLDVAKNAIPASYFRLDELIRRENNLLSAWYTLRVN